MINHRVLSLVLAPDVLIPIGIDLAQVSRFATLQTILSRIFHEVERV